MPPETTDLYLDVPLTNVSIAYRNPGFVAEEVLPIIPFAAKYGKYPVFGYERFMIPMTHRAPQTAPARIDWSLAWTAFEAEEQTIEVALDDQQRQQSGSVNAERSSVNIVTEQLLLAREKRVADLVLSTSVITQYDTLAGDEQWDDADYAAVNDPIARFLTAQETIAAATGMVPNRAVMSRQVFNALRRHPLILERVSMTGTGGRDARVINAEILAQVFDLERVLIADTQYNSAKEGASVDIDPVWSDSVLIYHYRPGPELEMPRLGAILNWEAMALPRQITRYREARIKSDVFQCTEYVDEVVMSAPSGYLLTDVLA
jgi:hypothetical protein